MKLSEIISKCAKCHKEFKQKPQLDRSTNAIIKYNKCASCVRKEYFKKYMEGE